MFVNDLILNQMLQAETIYNEEEGDEDIADEDLEEAQVKRCYLLLFIFELKVLMVCWIEMFVGTTEEGSEALISVCLLTQRNDDLCYCFFGTF